MAAKVFIDSGYIESNEPGKAKVINHKDKVGDQVKNPENWPLNR